jgi:hypothetical protein
MSAIKDYLEQMSDAMGYGGEINEHVMRVGKRVFDLDIEPSEAIELLAEIAEPMFTTEQVDNVVRGVVAELKCKMMRYQLRVREADEIALQNHSDACERILAEGGAS